jgi:hypothetical protein
MYFFDSIENEYVIIAIKLWAELFTKMDPFILNFFISNASSP